MNICEHLCIGWRRRRCIVDTCIIICAGSSNRKLTLLYVANDIIQNSKHKGPEFRLEFTRALPKAFQLVSKYELLYLMRSVVTTPHCSTLIDIREKGSESLKKSVGHILSVWQERRVFDHDMITKLKTILCESCFVYSEVQDTTHLLTHSLITHIH